MSFLKTVSSARTRPLPQKRRKRSKDRETHPIPTNDNTSYPLSLCYQSPEPQYSTVDSTRVSLFSLEKNLLRLGSPTRSVDHTSVLPLLRRDPDTQRVRKTGNRISSTPTEPLPHTSGRRQGHSKEIPQDYIWTSKDIPQGDSSP